MPVALMLTLRCVGDSRAACGFFLCIDRTLSLAKDRTHSLVYVSFFQCRFVIGWRPS